MKRPRLRRMKAYHPRKKRTGSRLEGKELQKQSLHDLKHKIGAKVSRYLVLLEEGNKTLLEEAHHSAKNNLMKYSSEMQKVAAELGERVNTAVQEYLSTLDQMVHLGPFYVDPEKIKQCYEVDQKLEKTLNLAA